MVIITPFKDNGNSTDVGTAYVFTLCFGVTWMEHKTNLQVMRHHMTSLGVVFH